ncbi:MAG: SDR family NAD(P)-dependent oxidoreductase [Chloroflexi bacterium]|nr:MAG: SDR family NAD(P)-dependent oxidoreductase [Chloroflexota bacterium]
MNAGSLKNQVVLITGAGRPPAPGLAAALAAQGAIVAANDLSPVLLDPLSAAVTAQGGRIQAYIADASRGMPLRAMLDEVLEDFGRIDILVNNPRVRPDAPLLAMDEWDWQRTIEMNLNGPFLVTQLVARLMKDQGGGAILNLVDTQPASLEVPGRAAYAASQRGMLALSQAAARELIAYNIRVHTLCTDEMLLDTLFSQPSTPGGTLSELAIFLCSPEAAHLSGQIYRVSYNTEERMP